MSEQTNYVNIGNDNGNDNEHPMSPRLAQDDQSESSSSSGSRQGGIDAHIDQGDGNPTRDLPHNANPVSAIHIPIFSGYDTRDPPILYASPTIKSDSSMDQHSLPLDQNAARTPSVPDSLSRFRRAGQQVVAAHRLSTYAMRGQGVDVSSMDAVFSCIKNSVDVTVMDLNQTRYSKRTELNNADFITWLEQPRPLWSKVRWININGMSWDVIKAIAIKFNLHHLAVEDLLHVPQRTKVDVYPQQTYIACTLLTLMETLEDGQRRQVDPISTHHGIDPSLINQRIPLENMDHYRHRYPLSQVSGALNVQMEQVTMFLLDDGTLITIFQVSGKSVVSPVVERLTHDYSIVRKNNDASFLLQSIIDGIVDHAIPITDAFRQEINGLETHVLALPRMKFTRELHQMAAQLTLLKRTLAPTQMLVHSLRSRNERSPLTSLSRTYMGDVMDHCNTMVEDIDTMLGLCEKLIDMIFNLVAYDTNESMRRLALVSIIFLPITFVAGVYGTNFQNFPELEHHISYFWIICSVVTAIVLMLFAMEWLQGQWRASKVEKRLRRREPISVGTSRKRQSHDLDR